MNLLASNCSSPSVSSVSLNGASAPGSNSRTRGMSAVARSCGVPNSVRAQRNQRFAGRTLILAPHSRSRSALLASQRDRHPPPRSSSRWREEGRAPAWGRGQRIPVRRTCPPHTLPESSAQAKEKRNAVALTPTQAAADVGAYLG
jgi:hypothetical protein